MPADLADLKVSPALPVLRVPSGPRAIREFLVEMASAGSRGSKVQQAEGPPGLAGPQGLIGAKGDPGIPGRDGVRGERGHDGISIIGPEGPAGARGERGLDGKDGQRGERGIDGKEGQRGERGVDGKEGQRGERGIDGAEGKRGERGLDGRAGERGERGIDGKDGQRGEKGDQGERGPEGLPGKLVAVKDWQAGGIAYAGELFSHAGATWQARRDTSHEPMHHGDWICVAAAGRDARTPFVRATYDPNAHYAALDIAACNGGSFIARKDNPGPCPGDDWQMISRQGSTRRGRREGLARRTGPARRARCQHQRLGSRSRHLCRAADPYGWHARTGARLARSLRAVSNRNRIVVWLIHLSLASGTDQPGCATRCRRSANRVAPGRHSVGFTNSVAGGRDGRRWQMGFTMPLATAKRTQAQL